MKKPPVVILVTLLIVTLPTPSPGCGIAQTMLDLAGTSDAIVLARVEAVERRPRRYEDPWDEDTDRFEEDAVTLRVLEAWKGDPGEEIQVQFSETPTPFRAGDVVLLFLESGDSRVKSFPAIAEDDRKRLAETDVEPGERTELTAQFERDRKAMRRYADWARGRWFSASSLPSEVTFPRVEDRAGLKELILDAVRLQARPPAPANARIEWYVRAAERRITRYDGLLGLRMEAWVVTEDEMAELEDPGFVPAPKPVPLTRDQWARLAAGFAREPAVDFSDMEMLELLADYPDLEVDRTAASIVEAGFLIQPIDEWVVGMVELVLRREGDDFSARIGRDDRDPSGRLIVSGPGNDTLPTIWEVARRDLGIPETLAAEVPDRRIRQTNDERPLD